MNNRELLGVDGAAGYFVLSRVGFLSDVSLEVVVAGGALEAVGDGAFAHRCDVSVAKCAGTRLHNGLFVSQVDRRFVWKREADDGHVSKPSDGQTVVAVLGLIVGSIGHSKIPHVPDGKVDARSIDFGVLLVEFNQIGFVLVRFESEITTMLLNLLGPADGGEEGLGDWGFIMSFDRFKVKTLFEGIELRRMAPDTLLIRARGGMRG